MKFKVYDNAKNKFLDERRYLIDGKGRIYYRASTGDLIDMDPNESGWLSVIEVDTAHDALASAIYGTDTAIELSTREAITKACDELKKTLLDKNSDYGDAFGETYRKLGPITGLTRFLDKSSRITHLTQKMLSGGKNEVKDETLEDTWKDAAGYAILNMINLKKWRKNN